jgi:dTDP-glucose 4,6-dehydratase
VAIARCFTFVGEFLPLNSYYIIGNFIKSILEKKNINIYSNYKIYRSYMYADDLVRWLLKILFNSNTKCKIYNVGSDNKVLLRKIADNLAKKYDLQVCSSKIYSDKVDCYVPNVNKAKKNLKLKNNYSSFQAIKKTLNFHLKSTKINIYK